MDRPSTYDELTREQPAFAEHYRNGYEAFDRYRKLMLARNLRNSVAKPRPFPLQRARKPRAPRTPALDSLRSRNRPAPKGTATSVPRRSR